MARVKNARKSRTSRGIQGHPSKTKTSTGMQKLLNQVNAFHKGKKVALVINAAGHKVSSHPVLLGKRS